MNVGALFGKIRFNCAVDFPARRTKAQVAWHIQSPGRTSPPPQPPQPMKPSAKLGPRASLNRAGDHRGLHAPDCTPTDARH